MNMIYQKQFQITDLHLDCFQRIKPSVLLYFAQEVATDHAAQLGTDWETLAQKHLFWAVIRHKVQITRLPQSGETITVETWPLPATRVAYPRATIAYDAQGKELFRTMALWVLMDTQTRSMILPGKSGVDVPGIVRGLEADTPGSIVPKTLANAVSHIVSYTLLDRNGHMNNTRYMDWVADLFPSAFHQQRQLREIQLCYFAESLEGDTLSLCREALDQKLHQVDIHREKDGKEERIFSARLTYDLL